MKNTQDAKCVFIQVPLDSGVSPVDIRRLVESLDADTDYMWIDIHGEQSSAYGFVESEYYEENDYDNNFISEPLTAILNDQAFENTNGVYTDKNGELFTLTY